MENINFNELLDRQTISNTIKNILLDFEKNKHNLLLKRSVYIYGAPGIGKTSFVNELLKEMNYDIVKYDAGDIRNKNIIDTITKHNMSDKNVLSMFQKRVKKIVIFMDEIDGMNNGDKGGINSLIKLIRPKKTKKQKTEEITFNPIICVGNYHMDKKIKELMKVCHVFELKTPTPEQIRNIITLKMPQLDKNLYDNIIKFTQCDLRKLISIYNIYKNQYCILNNEIIQNIFKPKSYNEDTKEITKKLINNKVSLDEHNIVMNETDRTIVSLLWHENIIDVLSKTPKSHSIPLYTKLLDNICYADYIDRITFQKQIWQFNEMSSLIKTFYNNKIYHEKCKNPKPKFNPTEVRFTKVLTKYSTEYNNSLFIQNLCQQLGTDKKDTFSYFLELRNNHTDEEIYEELQNYEITKLDINRIYRYIDKYTKKDCAVDETDGVECELEESGFE
jgi:DNA polymerase III delta prime subunit